MKTLVSVLVLFFALLATPSFSNGHTNNDSVTVLSTKRYIFYFKIDKNLIGATIEVWNGDTLIQTDKALHVKNIVDFFYLAPGDYTIKVKKATEEFVFAYTNKE